MLPPGSSYGGVCGRVDVASYDSHSAILKYIDENLIASANQERLDARIKWRKISVFN
jgi:hypothetical protein